ncbi:hypothetical protein SASPL_124539 [Salvia splendens]|uniref:Phosphatidylinositol glycan, class S n=1 Tax=Salvia splendens TaxID=180675 RepID=A0A8X8XI84_SALSN|nr:hypothetical protein SASPL_124539 [Salvia splendens]
MHKSSQVQGASSPENRYPEHGTFPTSKSSIFRLKRAAISQRLIKHFDKGNPVKDYSTELGDSRHDLHDIHYLANAIQLCPLFFPWTLGGILVEVGPGPNLCALEERKGKERKGKGARGSSFDANELSVKIEHQMRKIAAKDSTSCGACSYNSSLNKYEDSGEYNDELFDEYLHSLVDESDSRGNGGNVYTMIVVRREGQKDASAVVGKYRHGWIVGRVSEEEAVKKVASVFVKAFVNGGKEEGSISGEFMPVGADGKIVLSFNLLNADPHDWIYDWEFQEIDDNLLAPILKYLKPIADISVESQVLYHTPKSSFSYWDEKLWSYIFTTKDLPFFVNSNEWHLDTSVAAGGRSKILHLVVYVPSATECPLLLQLPNGKISKSNGFISPMWGSVVVWNHAACLNGSKMDTRVRHTISSEDMRKIFEVFIGQLRQLFGLKSKGIFRDTSSGTIRLLTSEMFGIQELDVLSRQHTCFNLLQCTTTLGSLSRLVQSLPRMIIKEEIGEQVRYSLEAAKSALSNVSAGIYDASAVSSRRARSFSEDAFYHPSMMSVSYYSFEHCFAVYSPFFLPVALHVLLAALREWKRYKQESRKFKAWKAKKD